MLQHAQSAYGCGDLGQARTICETLVRRDPRNVEAHGLLGRIALDRGETEQAAAHFSRCVALRPKDPRGHLSLGETLTLEGRYDQAVSHFDRVLRLQPEHPLAIARKAEASEKAGNRAQARSVLEPFVSSGRETPEMGVVQARLYLHEGNHEAIVALAQRHKDADPLVRRHLTSLLGKAMERSGRFDEAFDAYRRANESVTVPFDAGGWRKLADAVIEAFPAGRLETLPRAGNGSQTPVFIVGMPRSGSTLIETILDAHPEVRGVGEFQAMPQIVSDIAFRIESSLPYPACVEDLSGEDVESISRSYLDRLTAVDPHAVRLVDKNLANYFHLGLIALLFPEARVIHARRHPLDTCLSCYCETLIPAAHPYASDLESLGAVYLDYERLMAHWHDVLDIRLLDVQYETLVDDQESVSRSMVEFCGLPWDDRCLRYYETARVVGTLSYDQVTRPVYRSSMGRYRDFEKHLEPLVKVLADGGCELR